MKKYIILFCTCCFLSACSGFAPFVDARREAGTTSIVGESRSDMVVICYGAYGTTPEEILKLAVDECAKTNRYPKFVKQTLMSCTLFEPTRVYYKCE